MPYTSSQVPDNHFDGGANITRGSGKGPTLAELQQDVLDRVAGSESAMHDPVANVTALKAVTDYSDKMTIFCESKGEYYYESTSAAANDDDLVVQPTAVSGNGRWLLMQRLSPDHHAQHDDGGADELADLPGTAVLGGSAVTVDNIVSYLPSSDEKAGIAGLSAANPVQDLSDDLVVETADGAIAARRLVMVDAAEDHLEATAGSVAVAGINNDNAALVGTDPLNLRVQGKATAIAACPIKAGRNLKAADGGRVCQLVDAATAGVTIDTGVGLSFTNQPANDAVDLVSSDAGDTTQTATVIGTTTGTDTVVTEDIALNGVVAVTTVKVDWGEILAIKLNGVCAGTITASENSGSLAITTIAPAALQSGVITVPAVDQGAHNVAPTVLASGATTQQVGCQYTAVDGVTRAYMADTLAGAVAQTMPAAALLVTEIYIGSLENTRTVTFAVGAEEDELRKCGKSLAPAAARDAAFSILMTI